jgi:hypothetical protein
MNNSMLSFSGADLSRLRTLVEAVDKDIALLPRPVTVAGSPAPSTTLDMTWSNLVTMLALGTEPKTRECPACKHACAHGASRCGHCWTSLPAMGTREKTAA